MRTGYYWSLERMLSGAVGVVGLALIEEYGRLAFPYRKLRAVFYLARPVIRDPVDEDLAGAVEPFYDLEEYYVVRAHPPDLLLFVKGYIAMLRNLSQQLKSLF